MNARKIFVLHVHTLPWVSGSGLNTFLSMKYLDSSAFTTALACAPGGRLEELVTKSGFVFHPLSHMKAPVSPLHDLAAVSELKALIQKLCPDIVHTHNSKAGFIGRLAARLAGGAKVVHTVHGFSFHDRETAWRRMLFRFLERKAVPWTDRFVAISEELRDWGAREGIGDDGGMTVIWSGIEIERFAEADRNAGRRRLGLDDSAIAVGLVSKLWEGKGHRFIMDVMKSLLSSRVKLVFIGEGELERELRALAASYGEAGRNILFAGFHDDTAEVTKALDIAVLPSDFEGMGRVLLEAQAAGVPVLANDVGGMKNVVADKKFLIRRGDTDGWRRALAVLIESSEARRAAGAAGARFVGEKFSAVKMAKDLEAVYRDVLGVTSKEAR